MRSAAAFVGFIVVVALAASFGGVFQPGACYEALRKPPLTPPNWIFAPVWSFLYLCIALAAWLVWQARRGLALLEIAVLLALVVATAAAFFRVRPLAGALLVPYTMWVAFASYLNEGVWVLNR